MSSLVQWLRKHERILLRIAAIFLILALLSIAIYQSDVFDLFMNRDRFDEARNYLLSFGSVGYFVFIFIVSLQVIIAPIPGQVTGLVGGYVYGPYLGTLLSSIGLGIGTMIVLILSRKFGRPFLEKLNSQEALAEVEILIKGYSERWFDRFQKGKEIGDQHSLLIFFLLMLLPAFPDDIICMVMGLGSIAIWKLVLLSVLGRLPGMLALSFTGAGLDLLPDWAFYVGLLGIAGMTIFGSYILKKIRGERY
ncbi:TVP38/TMEM64 family protein [Pseudobacteriovorax antillogorgiicola]|uniref:TVP38/TMEM64 family membrane protein n=1 Tax=Pseudobacteriovorax antillogorgiicola TaxID=1513793 RepID=A0A1Y6B821_9BACT|nr:VTT domain-containing protein [Pseudobacteriovorax antillogorgiicola]TCS58767.1 putative membrane protein YdjX (TVP38/TMEM64 family) [Pseudobacteriovorax antillogorgiicola]SME94959.1 Uncharacterized membrane protein YdjX, TVP38/TMEM64 family, SNARE-associated domain [Pseudobacteriovorax antillogorgiicola]